MTPRSRLVNFAVLTGSIMAGQAVTVYYRPGGDPFVFPTSVQVRINDKGPWLKVIDASGAHFAVHPTRVIDLTPTAFERLTGDKALGKVQVSVGVPCRQRHSVC